MHHAAIQKADQEAWAKFEADGTEVTRLSQDDVELMTEVAVPIWFKYAKRDDASKRVFNIHLELHEVGLARLYGRRAARRPQPRPLSRREAGRPAARAACAPSGRAGGLSSPARDPMPSISFELPHWLYWLVLFAFPAFAMVMARRPRPEGYSIPLSYLIWATGGILGLHRLYLKNLWGLLFLPLFLAVLYANAEGRDARNVESDAANAVRVAERVADRARGRLDGSDERIAEAEAALAAAEEGSFAARRAERALERERESAAEARERLAAAEADIEAARPALVEASAARHSGTTPRNGSST
jgi:hypothetical protein